MIRLDDLALFCLVADVGSFTAAGKKADLAPRQVSARIRRLEGELATPLFIRTTRKVALTDEGQRYLPHALEILDRISDSARRLRSDHGDLSGDAHVVLPSALGRNVVGGWLARFRDDNPAVRLRVTVSDNSVDVFRERVDAVIRYGMVDDAECIAMPLVQANRRVLVASPSYVADHGIPTSVDDLQRLRCLAGMLRGRPHDAWQFCGRDQKRVKVAPFRVSNDTDLVRQWAIAGDGIAYKSWLDVANDVQHGRLVLVLPDAVGEPLPLSLVSAHRRDLSPAVRRLYAALSKEFDAFLGIHPLPLSITR